MLTAITSEVRKVKHSIKAAGQFPCTHSRCSIRLKSKDALRTHIRAQHEDR